MDRLTAVLVVANVIVLGFYLIQRRRLGAEADVLRLEIARAEYLDETIGLTPSHRALVDQCKAELPEARR